MSRHMKFIITFSCLLTIFSFDQRLSLFAQDLSNLGKQSSQPKEKLFQQQLIGTLSENQQKFLNEAGIPKEALKHLDLSEESSPYDQLPDSLEDLAWLEETTVKLVPKYQEATVNIQVGMGQGSGVVISPQGHILTAAHVVGEVGKSNIVIFPDGSKHRAVVIGIAPNLDAAICRLKGNGPYPYIPMATNEFTEKGRWVIAIGHPNGYETDRSPVVRLGRVLTTTEKTVQTDCSLVGGDSGGPLFDLNGRVVGIHSRIGVSNSINFHVPVQIYLNDWADLTIADNRKSEKGDDAATEPPPPKKAFLGIRGRDIARKGCLITQVTPNGPAAKGDVRVGDVIIRCSGKQVKAFRDLVAVLKTKSPGDEITLIIDRDGKREALKITLGGTEL